MGLNNKTQTQQAQQAAAQQEKELMVNECAEAYKPLPVIDQLRSERARHVKAHYQFMREIDRQISELEETSAEDVMQRSYKLLDRSCRAVSG